jgi:hypothetical protein
LATAARIQSRAFKPDAPEILTGVLRAFNVTRPVSLIGHCGGSASFMRAFVKFPQPFQRCNHVFHNCVTAQWPPKLDAMLQQHKCRLLVTWIEDSDHMRWCVAHKHLTKLAKRKAPFLDFYNVASDVLAYIGCTVPGMGRQYVNSGQCFRPSTYYMEQILTHVTQVPPPTSKQKKPLSQAFCQQENLSAMDVLHGK